jgi:hypothetical protein
MKLWAAVIPLLVVCACATPAMHHVSYSDSIPIGAQPRLVRVEPGMAAAASGRVDLTTAAAADIQAAAFDALARTQRFAQAQGFAVVGPPIIVNREVSRETWSFDVMLPIESSARAISTNDGVTLEPLPNGVAVALDHHGSIDTLHAAYERIAREAPQGVTLGVLTWEQYITDPTRSPAHVRVFRAAVED